MLSLVYIHNIYVAMITMAIFGMAWIVTISSLNVAAQMALPDWVRSHGNKKPMFIMSLMGSLAGGSLIWGKIAKVE